jgi:hypothetical protein
MKQALIWLGRAVKIPRCPRTILKFVFLGTARLKTFQNYGLNVATECSYASRSHEFNLPPA